MRWLFALLVAPVLAGCLADGPTDGTEPTLVADRKGVVFVNEEYDAVPNVPATLSIEVPEGAVNVLVELRTTRVVTAPMGAEVDLSGCGAADMAWGSGGTGNIVVQIGGSWSEATLCGAADGGGQTLTITANDAPLTGSVILRADIPSGCCYE